MTTFEWVACACIAIVVAIVTLWVPSERCEAQARVMGFPHKWGVLEGCLIEVKGQWVPMQSYRVGP